MNRNKRTNIFTRFHNLNSSPTTELKFNSVFELLIAVLLSSRSSDMNVNKVTEHLYSIANTPLDLIELGINNIKQYICRLGLFNRKSENIIKICHILLDNHCGKVPADRKALESLPGVGRKTANVVLNIAFGWPVIAVDTHVFRVSNRTGLATGKNVREVEYKLLKFVPSKFKTKCHNWLVLHGKYICKAYKPRCNFCYIKDLCEYKHKTEN